MIDSGSAFIYCSYCVTLPVCLRVGAGFVSGRVFESVNFVVLNWQSSECASSLGG